MIACRYFLELSEEETAAALGVRIGTVKSRTSRALDQLREESLCLSWTLFLNDLGRHVEFPPTPDLAPACGGGSASGAPGAGRSRSPLPCSSSRSAPPCGPGGAHGDPRLARAPRRAHRAGSRPAARAPAVGNLDLGRPVTLGRGAPPSSLASRPGDEPDRVYFSTAIPRAARSLLWGRRGACQPASHRVPGPGLHREADRADAKVEPVDIGDKGVWLEEPHVLAFHDLEGSFRENTARLAGKTLLWQAGNVTLRLEGELSKEDALRIARSAG